MTNEKKLRNFEFSPQQIEKIESLQPIISPAIYPPSTKTKDNMVSPCCSPQPEISVSPSSCCGLPTPISPTTDRGQPCCGPRIMTPQKYIEVSTQKKDGITYVSSQLNFKDRIGNINARLGKSRMAYAVEPGLYAVGAPNSQSEVLVTANYKLSFDVLRIRLENRSFWILVLNTYGVNVWCAAGKGTFGTQELINRIEQTELSRFVAHRRIIVPQLGAPGVSGHIVKQQTGFRVVFGPVNAEHINQFVDNKLKADPKMRKKTFPFFERMTLVPIELRPALRYTAVILAISAPLAALAIPGDYLRSVVQYGVFIGLYLLASVLAGAILTPMLLPYLPGRAFSVKSLWPSLLLLVPLGIWLHTQFFSMEIIALSLISASLAAFFAMNFTGASTYTSISGVKKEMRIAVPLEITGAVLGIIIWITGNIIA